jgi:imidazolonepropionase-like amidohydrolase
MLEFRRVGSLGLLIALLGVAAQAQNATAPLVVRGGTVIDGTGKPPQKGVTIVINQGKIQAVALDAKAPNGAEIIDATGKFIIPGLIDVRVQVGSSPGNRVDRAEVGIEQRLQSLRALLAAGVTTARLFHGDFDEQKLYSRWQQEDLVVSPRLLVAGPTFTAPGGHPTEEYSILATFARKRETREIANADQAREKSRELTHTGLEVFEAVYDKGPQVSPYHRLDKDVLETLIAEAHGFDLKFFCEVGGSEEAATAIASGVDVIEGAWEESLPDNLLAEMARKHIFFLPALTEQGDLANLFEEDALKSYLEEPVVQRTLSETIKKGLASKGGTLARLRSAMSEGPGLGLLFKQQQERAFANVHRAQAAGVAVAVGTGSGSLLVFPGAAVHRELQLLVKAGLSPLEAIVAATRNSALSMGKGSELGTIEVGKIADLVILSADPLEDIRNTQQIDRVIQNGRVVPAKDLIVH